MEDVEFQEFNYIFLWYNRMVCCILCDLVTQGQIRIHMTFNSSHNLLHSDHILDLTGIKHSEYKLCTHTPKLSNQNVYIQDIQDTLFSLDVFLNKSTKKIENFITERQGIYSPTLLPRNKHLFCLTQLLVQLNPENSNTRRLTLS